MIDHIVNIARAHALVAYLAAFVLTGAEAFPVIGALVPGTAVIVSLGALVPAGALRFWPLAAWATAGAIAGDGLGYWFGHHYREQAQRHWPLRGRAYLLERGQVFLRQHGAAAIIIARFTPGVRAVVPLIAGIGKMGPRRFIALDVVSALLWAPAHVFGGVVIGASLTVLGAVAGRLEFLIVAALVVGGAALLFLPYAIRGTIAFVTRQREPLLVWASRKDDWLRRQVRSLLDPSRTELPGLLALCAALVASLWLFLGVLQDLIAGDPLVHADHTILHFVTRLRADWATQLAVVIVTFGNGIVTLFVAGTSLVWLDRINAWRAVAYGIASVIGAVLFTAGLDLALHRSPPTPAGPVWNLFPFPGGHTAVLAALYSFIAILVAARLQTTGRLIVAMTTFLFIVAEGGARVYLGAGWLSTELAAAAFGIAWAISLGLAYLVRPLEDIPPRQLVIVAGSALLVAGFPVSALTHQAERQRYALRPVTRVMSYASWQQESWRDLPARRLDLFGFAAQPLDIQWLGSAHSLEAVLQRQGWRPAPARTWRSVLSVLAPNADATTLPTVPQWQNGLASGLVMIKATKSASHSRLVLRLWPSQTDVVNRAGRHAPLWLGAVDRERLQRLYSVVIVPKDLGPAEGVIRRLADVLPGAKLVLRGTRPVLLAGTLRGGRAHHTARRAPS